MPRASLVQSVIQHLSADDQHEERLEDKLEPFLGIARWIPRALSPYINLAVVIDAGIGQEDENESDEYEIAARIANGILFEKFIAMHEELPALMDAFAAPGNDDALNKFIKRLSVVICEARSQDTNAVKMNIISYLPVDPNTETVHPPIIGRDKSKRGWNHKWTARFLCPLMDREDFASDPLHYMNQVQKGKKKLYARALPSFLYPEGTVFDERYPDKDLFRGHLLIRGLRLIYTGESSAFTGHRSATKPSQAEIHGMREVTPEAVAYTACQIYINLSSLENWAAEDGHFSIEDLFDICMSYFTAEPIDEEWTRDTLKYLTSQLPSLRRKTKRKRGVLADDSDSEVIDKADPTGILALRRERAEARLREASRPRPAENVTGRAVASNMSAPAQQSGSSSTERVASSRHRRVPQVETTARRSVPPTPPRSSPRPSQLGSPLSNSDGDTDPPNSPIGSRATARPRHLAPSRAANAGPNRSNHNSGGSAADLFNDNESPRASPDVEPENIQPANPKGAGLKKRGTRGRPRKTRK